jgi:hypothetical protein
MQTQNYKLDADAPSLCNGKVVLKKQGKNSMKIKEFIGPGGYHGASTSLGCYPLLK